LPEVTEDGINVYLNLSNQSLRKKIIDMYRGKFIRSVRYSISQDITYISSRISAEMIKNCTYNVDISVDMHGVVLQAQCECSAGSGPNAHCKHVAVTLYALTQVKQGIFTKETCTQQLQTFHQAKAYTGSPVKMQDLRIRGDGRLVALPDFDPRPPSLQNMPGYQDLFRNTWINQQSSSISVLQLFPPANLYAVNNDHDYLDKPPSHLFLDSMSITSINENERGQIEMQTRDQSKSKTWKFERTKRLHSSNFGRICTAGDKTNFPNLARSLTKTVDFRSNATDHGKKYEHVAVEAYQTITDLKTDRTGICVYSEIPYLAASPDGLVNTDGIIEVKCPYSAKDDLISIDSVSYLKEDANGILYLNDSHPYYYQVQGTLLCTGRHWCDFIVWTFRDIKVVRIQRDAAFIDRMICKLQHFFHGFFKDAVLDKFYYRC